MERRIISRWALLLGLWLGLGLAASGCGGVSSANDDDPPPPELEAGDLAGTVTPNHGHYVWLTAEQLADSSAVTLELTGSHVHEVALTAAQVIAAGADSAVTVVTTSTNAHTHVVDFN